MSRELQDRAILAMAAAIEVYNKPGFPYRSESFTILAINGWELALKAKWLDLHRNDKRSLYVYEHKMTSKGKRSKQRTIRKTRSKSPFTHDAQYLANQMVMKRLLHPSVSQNIDVMLEFRDCATHFYNNTPAFGTRLYEIGAACVQNFVHIVHEWFRQDMSEFRVQLMPLAFVASPSSLDGISLNREEKNFLNFLNNLDEEDDDPQSPYSISVNVELRFRKSKSNNAMEVIVTNDPSALPVKLIEEDIREQFPWDYGTLTDRCRLRYDDFKINRDYHDVRKRLEADERFARLRFLDPGNPRSSKKIFYSPSMVSMLDKHYIKKDTSR